MIDSLHLTLDFPPMSHGGISTAVGEVVELLTRAEHRAGVISYDDWRPTRSQVESQPIKERAEVWRVRTPEQVTELLGSECIGEIGRVVVHHPLLWEDGETLSSQRKVPIDFVIHVDTLYVAHVTNREVPSHYLELQERIVSNASRIIALSSDVEQRWRSDYPGLKIHRAPLPLVRERSPTKPTLNLSVLSVGRFDFVKGTDILATTISSVLRRLPAVNWTHVGGNPASPKTERRWMRKLVDELGEEERSRFEMVPWRTSSELEAYYQMASVVVIPSRYETFGLVAAEAIGHGLPVVAFAVGGLGDTLVDNVTGYTVSELNVEHFIERVVDALEVLKLKPGYWRDTSIERSRLLAAEAKRAWLQLYLNGASL